MSKKSFIQRLKTEIVYLWDDDSDTLIKSLPLPDGRYMAKIPPDGKEFKIAADSDQVTRALIEPIEEVSQEIYDKNLIPTTDKAVSR